MEGSHDSYLASTSLRGSISRWRTSSVGAFSKSLREEDDEEALKWAALEKLPTYNRLRKGLLTTSRGEAFEVDVSNLGLQQRQRLINKLVKVTEVDNEKFLLKLKSRIDRVGIDLPKVEVRYEHLNVEGEAYLASKALPSFTKFYTTVFEDIFNYLGILPSRKKHLTILKDVSGRATYNGHDMGEFVPERAAAYISQHDNHIGEMTVRETLAFSARCQGVGSRYELLTELARRENEAGIKPDPDIDVYMKVLGLEVCADTMVGDEMIRGISGGERKRVTTGEMMVGPALALFMDEISTGLDSSTTFQIVNCLKQHVHINSGTAVISLLQPAPETYDLFDDIILLSDGQIVYQGPRELVLEFFESMGFKCPKRKGVADFLQEVTSRKDQKQYWTHKEKPYRFVTVEEFAEAFQSFHVGQKISDELRTPFDKSKSHRAALTTEVYGVGKRELLKTCISRELLLMKRNSFVYIFKLTQISSVALAFMTLFFRTKMHKHSVTDGGIYAGALFFATAMVMFNGLAEISMTIAKLPVFYKQRDFRFFPPWAYAIPSWILKIPISFLEVAVWVFLTYYVIGCDPNAGRFFKQYLLLLAVNQMASALFRLIAATGRSMVVANTFGTFALLVLFALGGFVLSQEDIKKWWKWAYWCSPMSYAQNAIVANEFLGYSWKKFTPNSYESIGVQVLKGRGGRNSSSKSLILTEAQGSHPKKRGMILPFEPHSLTFDEVVYSVDMPQEMKLQGVLEDKLVLLNGLSGAFRPGVLTALMGVSGAGKTTLMDVLSGRKTGGYITGNITISGYPKKQETFARISGYCEQNDIHSPFVTVYESLLYSAWLRLPPEVDSETRKMFIEEVMELVELKPLIQSLVGLPGVSGLSTEQRKRLTIAVELVANPSIIFMDEPTSGLDARAAAIVMRTVRNTVDTGRTVVCTIHQPGIDIFDAFDEFFLMKRGGQEIYVGPLGRHSCQLISYFEAIPGVEKIKDGYNPATWMLEVTASSQEVALGVDFNDIFRCSELYRRNKGLIEELSKPTPGSKDLYFPTQYSQSAFTQFMACLWKQHWSYWRNPQYTAVRFFFTAFIAVLLGSLFWDMGSKTRKSQDLFNAMGSMFTAIIFLGLQYCSSVQPVVSVERTVFYREKAAGMYAGLPWALAQAMIEIPYIFVQSVVYCVIVYAMMGYDWTAEKFSWYFFFMYITLLLFTFYGMLTVAITPNHHIAAIVSTLFYGIWYLFCGFVIPRPRIPVWWRWYYWANPIAWTLYGLIASQFGDVEDQMENGETVKHFLRDYFGFKHDFLGVVAGASYIILLEYA
ncbi:hypothetical protein WN944_022214 [Citrus x changshan-huyou]|uniref:ABC transporter domain-containing protein n=1 Tax=Citrus x changshan-huyou TaxID=2935761 RepID=A0AAP0MY30_9ROSI